MTKMFMVVKVENGEFTMIMDYFDDVNDALAHAKKLNKKYGCFDKHTFFAVLEEL